MAIITINTTKNGTNAEKASITLGGTDSGILIVNLVEDIFLNNQQEKNVQKIATNIPEDPKYSTGITFDNNSPLSVAFLNTD